MAARTRSAPPDALRVPKAHGHAQTNRLSNEQAAYERAYQRWHMSEVRRLDKEARARREEYWARLQMPLTASSPSGEFSDYEMAKLDFIASPKMDAMVTAGASWGSINNSASQRLSVELRTCEPFTAGVASARMPGERSAADFALLHARYVLVPTFKASLDAKLQHWRTQLLQRHGALARVKALSADARLIEIVAAATQTRGRPLDADGKPQGGKALTHAKKETYANGCFVSEFMDEFVDFTCDKPGKPTANAKDQILRATGLLFTNVPKNLDGRKQRGKPLHVPAGSTARGLRRDVARWRTEQASVQLGPLRAVFWDEGTLPSGAAVLVMGGSGLLPSGAVNRRFLGVRMPLPNKEGKTLAAAVLDICESNHVQRCYSPLSDSVSATVGHVTGAIAHLRQAWKTPLIFILKCTAHKVSRSWQKALQLSGGGKAWRLPVKRQQLGKTNLNRLVLLLEDNLFLLKKCEPVHAKAQAWLQGLLHLVSGHVDTRWEYALRLEPSFLSSFRAPSRALALVP